jgi:hypothetical protein
MATSGISVNSRKPASTLENACRGKPRRMKIYFTLLLLALVVAMPDASFAASKHSPASQFMSYEGRVMCGYQGWFRAKGDGSGRGWVHYSRDQNFAQPTIDLWPEVSEYPQTYATPYRLADGSPARVFSSYDQSTVEVHFRWMREYGIDGAFMQRFFHVTRDAESRREGRVILRHALEASQKHGRAIAVMYDLSGLKATGEDCSSVIQDWKELVDELKITAQGTNQTYLYHRGKPLVTIWGVGFPDRDYNIRNIGLERLIDFLKHDPDYGGCSVMLGVPTYFRNLSADTVSDPYLHELMAKADVIMPWMVGRFSSALYGDMNRYEAQVAADLAWCSARKLDYAPCVYPGFSWFNLSNGRDPFDAIPRLQGRFYWGLISKAVEAKARMIYVAMFDEMDEATAIFKGAYQSPTNAAPAKFLTYEGLPSDHYLWLTGQAGRRLRGEIPPTPDLYRHTDPKTRDVVGKTPAKAGDPNTGADARRPEPLPLASEAAGAETDDGSI